MSKKFSNPQNSSCLRLCIHSAAGIYDLPAPFSFNSLVYLHESNCLIACYGLELYRYNLCRILKYSIPIMRLIIYKSVHSKCSKQRSTIANQEHILLLTLTIMEMVGGWVN